MDETTINTVRVLGKVNDVELPEEIVQRFAFTYPNPVAAKTTAKISVSELKRRFAERDAAVSYTHLAIRFVFIIKTPNLTFLQITLHLGFIIHDEY